MSTKNLTRREFLRIASLASFGLVTAACAPAASPSPAPTLAPAAPPAAGPTAAPTTTPGPKYGGILKIGSTAEASVLGFPPNIISQQDFFMAFPCVESLGRFDASGRVMPYLATDFKEDPDAKTITVPLRRDVKFHDGTNFDAATCKWNLDQYVASGRPETKGIASVDLVDDYTVRVKLDVWDNTLLTGVGYFAGPMVSPTAFKANGKDWAITHPVGTGPFQFVSWERNVSLKYKKFDGYWQKGKPYLDGVEFRVIQDPLVASASLKVKEIDALVGVPALNAKDLEKSGGPQVLTLRTGNGAIIYGMMSDTAHPDSPFANVKVRQALAYAIDNKALVETLLYNYATPTQQWGPPANWSYDPSLSYPFNPAKAKQLLAEAGFPNGFKTKLTTNTRAPENVQVMTAIQGYLKAVGIDGEIDVLELGAWDLFATNRTGAAKVWNGLIWWSSRPDADLALVMPRNLSAGGLTYSHGVMRVDKLEKLFADARAARDFAAKKALCLQLQKMVIDELALVTPLYVLPSLMAKWPTVHDDGLSVTHNSSWTPENAWMG